jgi:hypothetical protein
MPVFTRTGATMARGDQRSGHLRRGWHMPTQGPVEYRSKFFDGTRHGSCAVGSVRFTLSILLASLASLCAFACGGGVEHSPSAEAGGLLRDTSDEGPAPAPDARMAGCFVVASNYDQTCTQDSDCVLVPPGGNICDPCSAGSGCLFCLLTSVNGKASAQYMADLAAALEPFEGTPQDPQPNGCVIGGCPVNPAPRCQAGQCTTDFGPICSSDGG